MPKKNSNSPPKELIESTHDFLQKEGCGVEHLVNLQKPNKPKIALAPIENPYDVDLKMQFARHDRYATQTTVVPSDKHLSDVIGTEYQRWVPGDVIFENVRCGCGKTKSFLDSLEYFRREKCKVLYVASREQLMRQTKLSVAKKLGSEYDDYPPECFDPIETFDNFVFFKTYQGLAKIYEGNGKFRHDVFDGKNKVVVYLDECHWLTSDALFSSQPENFMPGLIRQFPNAILVFMTATDWDCFEVIADMLPQRNKPKFINGYAHWDGGHNGVKFDSVYLSEPSKLNAECYSFNELEELVTKIAASESKWLLLMKSKKEAEKFKEMLKEAQVDSVEIIGRETGGFTMTDDARSEKKNISLSERFNCRVLITTPILDVGTNVNDRELKNVVVDVWDPVQAVQFVGRKRGKDWFNLYLHNLNISRVKELLITRVDEPLRLMRELAGASDAESNTRKDEVVDLIERGWLYKRDGKYAINRMAERKLLNLRHFLRHVLYEVDKYGDSSMLAHQLELFGFTLDECNDIMHESNESIRRELIDFVQNYVGRELCKDEYICFCKKLDEYLDKLGTRGRHDSDKYTVNNLNKIFSNNNLDFDVKNVKGIYAISRNDE